jgi:hypothetical protein
MEAKAWDKNKWHSDFAAQKGQDSLCYDEIASVEAEMGDYCHICTCMWCCYEFSEDEQCTIHCAPNTGRLPTTSLDLVTLLDTALEKRNQAVRAEFEELGWSEVGSEYVLSPKLEWIGDGDRGFEEEFWMI